MREKLKSQSCCSGLKPVDSSTKLSLTPSEVTKTLSLTFTHKIPMQRGTGITITLPSKLKFVKSASNAILTTVDINRFITSGL